MRRNSLEGAERAVELARFCRHLRRRINSSFRAIWRNYHDFKYRMAHHVFDGEHRFLRIGTISWILESDKWVLCRPHGSEKVAWDTSPTRKPAPPPRSTLMRAGEG